MTELSTSAFLASFDRFVGRSELPQEIWSDNGTNFVGASKTTLKELFKFLKVNEDEIVSHFATRECIWHFIPPHACFLGGLWEARVRSIKKHLRVVLASALFSYEQFETLLIQTK